MMLRLVFRPYLMAPCPDLVAEPSIGPLVTNLGSHNSNAHDQCGLRSLLRALPLVFGIVGYLTPMAHHAGAVQDVMVSEILAMRPQRIRIPLHTLVRMIPVDKTEVDYLR